MEKAKIIRTNKTQVVVSCPYCGKEHFHGLASVGSHVVSHCINAKPNDGYEIADPFEGVEIKVGVRKLTCIELSNLYHR